MSANLLAFPTLSLLQDRDGCYSLNQEGGITKRELAAFMAMQGLCACNHPHIVSWTPGQLAINAREQADAMLAELEKDSP